MQALPLAQGRPRAAAPIARLGGRTARPSGQASFISPGTNSPTAPMICCVVSGCRRTGRAPSLPWRFAPVPVSRRRQEACSRKSRSLYASSRAMSAKYHLEDVGLVDERHATVLDESEEAGRAVEVVDWTARVGGQHVAEEPAEDGAAPEPHLHLVLHGK